MHEEFLGDYRILKTVGQGAFGKVLLAEHRFIKKKYALKILPQELAKDTSFLQRFEAEVGHLATLDHPHIVKTCNVSSSEDCYFLITDCILDSIGEMTNLAQYMTGRKERLREEELFSLLMQVAQALDYAHSKKVIHKGLKLNNILVGKGNPGIDIFLSDFGLSQIVGWGSSVCGCFKAVTEALSEVFQENSLEKEDKYYFPLPIETHKLSKISQSFLQTYAFLAPEQKHFQKVDRAVDVYAFGILTYYLIAGFFPQGIFEMPSTLATEYEYHWDELITSCLQRQPQQRPSNIVAALEEIKQKKPVLKNEKGEFAFRVPENVAREQADLESVVSKPSQCSFESKEAVTMEVAVAKDLVEATAPVMTPSKDEKYSQALKAMLHRDPMVTAYEPEKKERKYIEPLPTEMKLIEGGSFFRGSPEGNRDESPVHKVFLDSFAIDIHPVTNEQFLRFLEYMGGEKDKHYNDLIRLKDSRIKRASGKLLIESGYAKHPVVGVSWYGALAYAQWVGKRLLTEAEWEVAASGGSDRKFPKGDSIDKSQANFFTADTCPVMQYPPNSNGLYDMAGNVYEWCQDWYGYNFYETSEQEPQSPQGPLQGVYRVLRGGCWKSLEQDLRCSHRHRNNPGATNDTYGFRCAADVVV